MNASSASPLPPRRYYCDDGTISESADAALSEVVRHVHVLYSHWLRQGGHRRDFPEAIAHTAEMLFIDRLMEGHQTAVATAPVGVPGHLATFKDAPAMPLRFYDNKGHLNPRLDISDHWPVLAPLFVAWTAAGWHARDFTAAARDTAAAVVYRHELCRVSQGMGGAQTEVEYLTTPFNMEAADADAESAVVDDSSQPGSEPC